MTSPAVSNGIYAILGATGNTGSIVANFLLSTGATRGAYSPLWPKARKQRATQLRKLWRSPACDTRCT